MQNARPGVGQPGCVVVIIVEMVVVVEVEVAVACRWRH